jgi:shikimate dehydrogenase
MKKYLVIGNPINHSLSPKLHNYWIEFYKINALYEKKKLNVTDLKNLITQIRKKVVSGVNVTVPFKKEVIKFLDKLSPEAEITQSVNTIILDKDKVIGHNTDIQGFESGIMDTKFEVQNKKIFILGSGGVVPSIIFALKKMKVSNIIIANRTKEKAESLKSLFKDLIVVDWGEVPDFDMIINATSIGLDHEDKINLDFSKIGNNKFFYDLIYNPKETSFLKLAKNLGHKIENGKKMFIYQAAYAFKLWHKIEPTINNDTDKILEE